MERYNLRSAATPTINEKVPEQTERSRLAGYVARDVTRLTAEVAPHLSDLGETSSPAETPETEIVQTMITQQSVTMFSGTRGEITSSNSPGTTTSLPMAPNVPKSPPSNKNNHQDLSLAPKRVGTDSIVSESFEVELTSLATSRSQSALENTGQLPHSREAIFPSAMEIRHPLRARDVDSPIHDTHSAGADSDPLDSDGEPIRAEALASRSSKIPRTEFPFERSSHSSSSKENHEALHGHQRQHRIAARDAARDNPLFCAPLPPSTAVTCQRPVTLQRPESANTNGSTKTLPMMNRGATATKAAPISAIQGWLNSAPVDTNVPPAPPVSRRTSITSYNRYQDSLPLGAEATTLSRSIRPSQHSRSSQKTQVTNRTMVSVPVGIIDLTQKLTQNLFELANAQRQDAREREAAILHFANCQREENALREQKAREENTLREQKIREDNIKREQLAYQREKLQTEAELQREKLLIEANFKEKERHAAAMQSHDEMAQIDKHRERELARAEAEREMKLIQQLADEKQKTAILQKEAEIQKLRVEFAQKISKTDNRNKISVQNQPAAMIFEPVVQHAQPPMPVQEPPVTQTSSPTSMSTEVKSIFDQTPMGLYTLLNSPSSHSTGATSTKINTNIASATQTVPTVLPITATGNASQPGNSSANLVDSTNYEVLIKPVANISAAQVFTSALSNSSNIMAVASSVTSGDVKSRAVLPAVEAPVVVVKQMEQVKPYNGTSSHRAYRDYFERVCKVNNWVSNADKAQHLSLALEGPAVELLKEVTEDRSDAYEQIWAAIGRRFGYLDEPERAMQRFDNRRQGDGETLAVFEQALRTIHREAWPNADPTSKDSALKRRFIAGLQNPEMQQFLRLHAKGDDFANTVARARQFQDAQDLAKTKKPNIRLAETYDNLPETNTNNTAVQPILDGLQKVLETVLEKQNKPSVRCARPNSESKSGNPNQRNQSRSQSPAPSDVSKNSNGSNGRQKTVRFTDQSSTDRDPPRSAGRNEFFLDSRNFRSRPDQHRNQNALIQDWDRPPPRNNDSGTNNTWQGRGREQPIANRPPERGRPFFSNGERPRNWPNDQGQPPWQRQRSSSYDSSASVDQRGYTQRRFGSQFYEPRDSSNNRNCERNQELGRPTGCYVCGQPGCHSRNHSNQRGPYRSNMSACFVCGQLGCHSRNHSTSENEITRNMASVTNNAANQTNWQRGSNQGDRAPPSTSPQRPQSN